MLAPRYANEVCVCVCVCKCVDERVETDRQTDREKERERERRGFVNSRRLKKMVVTSPNNVTNGFNTLR